MKVQCTVVGFHPATGLDLVDGEMEVTPEQAEALERAGFLTKKRASKPEKKEREG